MVSVIQFRELGDKSDVLYTVSHTHTDMYKHTKVQTYL